MREVSLQNDGIGEFIFDGVSSVLSSVHFGYPRISRQTVEKNDIFGVEISDVYAGLSEVTLEGFILAKEVDAELSHRLLSQIVGVGDTFTLKIGEFSRIMSADSLEFSPEVGFNSGYCEKFRLKAVSKDLFTRGEKTFCGEANRNGRLVFPITLGQSFGELSSHGKITVRNDGDREVGFVLDLYFPSASSGFVLTSNREGGNFAIARPIARGTSVRIDTRTGKKGIWDGSGTSILGTLDTRCRFFSVKPGETVLSWRNVSDKAPNAVLTLEEGFVTAPVWLGTEGIG